MHDTLDYFATPFGERPDAYHKLTFSMQYFYNELYLLALSHDEVVHGKKTIIDKLWGTYEEKCAQLRTLYFYMYTHPGKKLNFMGNEMAHFREWDEKAPAGLGPAQVPVPRQLPEILRRRLPPVCHRARPLRRGVQPGLL